MEDLKGKGRFFAHQEYPVGIALVVKDGGIQVAFEEHTVDRITANGTKIYLNLDAKLKSEFGQDRVLTLDVPKGLHQRS